MRVGLEAAGVVGPGLTGWPASREVLAGRVAYRPEPLAPFVPGILPANERRRVTATIRIALQAATETLAGCRHDPRDIASVFVSANGDLEISDRICSALTLAERPVSPIDFHNSVHNAPAGYWAIGTHCNRASTSISGGAASFAAGLIEAATQVLAEAQPVLLVAYDLPPPATLARPEHGGTPFAAGCLISPAAPAHGLGELVLRPVASTGDRGLANALLEALRAGSAAAQALLLLESIAGETGNHCILPYLDGGGLRIDYTPC